jgi:hypothetical protein
MEETALKKNIVLLVFVIFMLAGSMNLLEARTGIGVIIGEPTGISIRIGNFPVLGIAWSIFDNYFHLHCDYWLANKKLDRSLYGYYGLGVKLTGNEKGADDDMQLGARVPFGLRYYVAPKVELFAEVVPGMRVIPDTDFDIDGSIGVRFYL